MSADKDKHDVMKSSGALSVLTTLSRVLGLVREMIRGALMGTGGLGEAFTVAFSIPNLFRKLFAEGSTAAAFIPTFKGYLKDGNPEEIREFLSAIFTVLVVILTAFTALGIVFSDYVVLLFRSESAETAALTRIMFPFLAFVSFAAFFQGILNSVNVFVPTGLAPILFNLCFIFLPMALAPFLPNAGRAMAVAVTAGGVVQALCQLPAVLKAGFRFGLMNPVAAFRHRGTRKVMALIAPTILGMAAYELNSTVCISLASAHRAATALYYSLRLQELVLGMFVVSIGTVVLPILSAQAKALDWKGFNERMRRSLDAVSLFTLPVAVFSMLEGRDIVSVLFRIGKFGEESVALTSQAFFFHMLGLFFIGQNRIVATAFYAREDTRSPTFAGLASCGVNVLAAWLLSLSMKGPGIALALSIASAFNTATLALLLLRRPEIDRRALAASGLYCLRMLAFSLVAATPVFLVSKPLHALFAASGNRFLENGAPLLILGALFAAVGLGLLAITKDPNLGALTARMRGRRSA